MKIMFLGIAVWPSWEIAKRKMWIFLKSVERYGYDMTYYGVGTNFFPGYRAQKVDWQLKFLEEHGCEGYTHVLYTDCCDVLFTGGPEEIYEKYDKMGRPPQLVSASFQLGNVSDGKRYPLFDQSEKLYRYPNVGGYLMETPLLIETLRRFLKDYSQHGDDCFMWYDSWHDGWFRPVLDSDCQIFQWRGMEHLDLVETPAGYPRFHNRVTDSYPCIIHQSGGYADQDTFKDYAMRPIAESLGLLTPQDVRPGA